MPNDLFVCHPVSSLPCCCSTLALACCCSLKPWSSADIAVHGSCRKPPQSLPPICCLCRLSPLSLTTVVSRWRLPSFQFIVRHRHRHHRFLSHRRCVSCWRSTSLPSIVRRHRASCHQPVVVTLIFSGESVGIGGGPHHVFTLLISCHWHAHRCHDHHLLSLLLPTHNHPDKRCNWIAADGRRREINDGGTIDSNEIDEQRSGRWRRRRRRWTLASIAMRDGDSGGSARDGQWQRWR